MGFIKSSECPFIEIKRSKLRLSSTPQAAMLTGAACGKKKGLARRVLKRVFQAVFRDFRRSDHPDRAVALGGYAAMAAVPAGMISSRPLLPNV